MDRKLKVIFITQDEPFYIPKYIDNVLKKLGDESEVLKVYALPPNLSNKNFFQTVQDFFTYFGFIIFFYMVLLRVFYALSDFSNKFFNITPSYHSVKLVCNKSGIEYSKPEKINSEEITAEIRALNPDIIFSVACPQIFGEKLISIPSKGALNIHSSLLPQYRGLNANFWVLAKGEQTTGATIHFINPGIDDGDILLQEKIYIEDNWSLNDLYLKIIDVGSVMISRCLHQIYKDKITPKKNNISNGSYFTFPSKEDVKEFRVRNKRFFRYY